MVVKATVLCLCFLFPILVSMAATVASGESRANVAPIITTVFTLNPEQISKQPYPYRSDPVQIARLYAAREAGGLPLDEVLVSSWHLNKRNGMSHVYLEQTLHGLEILLAVANVNVDKWGRIDSAGSTLFEEAGAAIQRAGGAQPRANLTPADAVTACGRFLDGRNELRRVSASDPALLQETQLDLHSFSVSGASFALQPIVTNLKYLQTEGGEAVRLVWELEKVGMANSDSVYNAAVDAESGQLLYLFDYVSHYGSRTPPRASYKVYPLGKGESDPERADRELVKDPAHPFASPFAWHSLGNVGPKFTDTRGNNVQAQNNPSGGDDFANQHRPDGGHALKFDFPIDLSRDPSTYVDAAITNLFYWSNTMHDLLYVYGFDEAAGNFQSKNLGRGGVEGDPVVAVAQDGGGTDNANFLTLPDGEEGLMRMYVWTGAPGQPNRDGDLAAGIIIHEYSHGLSTRLTGGGANVFCLGWAEAGGLGEGWGDMIAVVLQTPKGATRADDVPDSQYVVSSPAGLREFLYSTNLETNPQTYSFLARPGYELENPHRIGAIWAAALFEVYWNLVDEFGFEFNWFYADSPAGNIVFIQLLVDGMKIQPCQPNFVQARDAMLRADQVDYHGAHVCALWRGFAKRGLGVSARGGDGSSPWNGAEAFDIPSECQ